MPQDIYITLGSWAIVILAAERTTEIINDSKFFFPMRNWLASKAMSDAPRTKFKLVFIFFHTVISCAWCLSVWVSMLFCLFLPGGYLQMAAGHNILVKWLALVGGANLWHAIFRLIFRGRVITVDITHTIVEPVEPAEGGNDGDELSDLGIVVGEDDDGEYSEGDGAAEEDSTEC